MVFGDLVFSSFGPQNSVRKRAQDLATEKWALEWVRTRTARDAVREGSLGQQLHELSDTEDITLKESANVMRGQLAAGVGTTVAALGYMIYRFAKSPDQY